MKKQIVIVFAPFIDGVYTFAAMKAFVISSPQDLDQKVMDWVAEAVAAGLKLDANLKPMMLAIEDDLIREAVSSWPENQP